MTSPRISFVIAAYNDAAGVARHLDRFARAGVPAEVIVVDDASTDGLERQMRATAPPAHLDLRYHRQPENLGPGPARNAGLELATAPYLMFLDADDLLAQGFFDYIALSPLSQGADFVLFRHHLCRDRETLFSYDMHAVDNRFFTGPMPCGFAAPLYTAANLPSALRIVNFPWNKVYRTAFLREAGIAFPALRLHEDIRPHWQSVLRARGFGVMNWAPPLVHHFETRKGTRATNYMGPDRRLAFETLREVHDEIAAHPLRRRFTPELLAFAEDLRGWMVRADPARAGLYDDAAEALYAAIGHHPGNTPPASEMGAPVGAGSP